MKVLVIGKGGREHAIVKCLSMAISVSEVHCIPGSKGMRQQAICHPLSVNDTKAISDFVRKAEIDLVVVGPEQPLADGVSDRLREAGIPVFGPSQEAAQLESSKIFSKEFMKAAGVPTAKFEVVRSIEETLNHAKYFSPPFVLKADGLAAGKGVLICKTESELETAAKSLFEEKKLGEAGTTAILEAHLDGWELSYLILTNGQNHQTMPLAQDHKRLNNDDAGPNTGGMGAVAPLVIDDILRKTIEEKLVQPILTELQTRQLLYRGVLYIGVMVTKDGPQVLEFNVRFGDPEAQVLLPLLEGDWGNVMLEFANGKVPNLRWKNLSSACVVLSSAGYPDAPRKGDVIEGDPLTETSSSYFLHAGTDQDTQGHWVTDGGRVLDAIALGSDLSEALEHAYGQARSVSWQGRHFRSDIGKKVVGTSR